MLQLELKILKIKLMQNSDPYSFIKNERWTSREKFNLHLRITAVDNKGNLFWFKTPNIKVTVTTGFLHYKTFSIPKCNKWFKIVEGEKGGVRGAKMFDGGDTPNVCIYNYTDAEPAVEQGQFINIVANETGKSKDGKITFLNRVKLSCNDKNENFIK